MNAPRRSIEAPLVAIFFLLLTGLTVYGFMARRWLIPVASEHGPGVDRVINYLLITAGAIFVIGHVVLATFIWRYSRGDAPDGRVTKRTELVWALIPVLILTLVSEVGVLMLGMPVWAQVYGDTPPDALQVEVVGKQFEWIVRYPGRDGAFGRVDHGKIREPSNPLGLVRQDGAAHDDLVLRGTLRLPAGRHVVVRLRSLDVLHSFWIPAFRTKQDCVPGFTARTQFVPTTAGTYELGCAELCGLGHYNMRGTVEVMEPAAFERWLAAEKGWRE